MDQIYIRFYCLRDPYTLIQIIATFKQLGTTHSEFDWEHRTNCISYLFKHFKCETHSVFKASAVLISSVIKIWRNKLVQKPCMASVDHDHFKAGTFCKDSRLAVTLYNICNLLLCKRCYLHSVRSYVVTRTILGKALLFIFICHVGSCILPRVRKFHTWNFPMSFNCICCKSKSSQRTNCCKVKVKHVRTIRFRMNYKLAHGYSCSAAFCTKLIKSTGSLSWNTVFINVCCTNWRCKHTVTECYVSQCNWLA